MTASITCPTCGMTSYHPVDIEQGYCGNCHAWTGGKMNDDKTDIVRRVRESVPLMVVGPLVTAGCDCPEIPVNYWRLPDGEWRNHGPVDPEMAEADATEYAAAGCTGWILACPTCHHVYISGVS